LDIPSPDSAPAALADLIAAGLVTHELIGDPSRLAGEADALRTLCGLVAGSVWRIEPFHYAFRVAPGDLGGACDGAPGITGVDAQASALEGALQAALGADTVWVNAADLVPAALRAPWPPQAAASPATPAGPLPGAPLLLLHAGDEARSAALEVAGPGAQAVIGARFALAAARLAAGFGEEGRLAERLAAIEARQAAVVAALEAEAARAERARSEQDAALDRLAGAITALAARIDATAAHSDRMAETVAETMTATMTTMTSVAQAAEETAATTGARLAELAAFREAVGLTLAEFLAEIERRSEAPMPVRVPQFG
jgi:flotillin